MLRNTLVVASFAAFTSAAAVAAFEPTPRPAAARSMADPCVGAVLPPPSSAPSPPTNLRIVSGSYAGEAFAEDYYVERTSGPYVESDAATEPLGSTSYFDLLTSRPDCLVAYTLRSQAELNTIKTGGESDTRYDVIYDSVNDAMLQRVDPTPFVVPGGGSVNAEQKIARISVNHTSMLLTWDFKIGPGAIYRGDGYLTQHKAYRIDYGDGSFWLTWKNSYARGANTGQGVAEMFMAAGSRTFLGPGTTNTSSEILEPRLAEFYPQVNTWTRYWFFVEGNIGGGAGGQVVYVSCWAADENRAPIRLYNRLQMYTPTQGLGEFRFEFNSSQTGALNDMMELWNRNLVVLQDVTITEVEGLLQKPLR
jgi:hypothetical protein